MPIATHQVPENSRLHGYIREFDGLRGIAILVVMVHHFWPRSGPLAEYAALPHLGWVGVDLFFVLSGCLITGILLDTRTEARFFQNFYARRVLRIFPLYFLFVAAAYLAIPLLQANSNPGMFVQQSGPAWWYFLYLGNIRESLTGMEPAYVLGPTWSLCIEEQFYLMFPLIVATLAPNRLRALLWCMVLFGLMFRTATMLAWPENERVQYLFTLSRVDTLSLGGLLALGFRGYARLPGKVATAILLPAALAICAVAFAYGGLDRTTPFGRTLGYTLVGLTAWLLVLWTAYRRGLAATTWLRAKPLVGLGIICYGVYILQRPAEVVLGKVLGVFASNVPSLDTVAGMGLKCAVAVAAGTASWFLIERPFLRLKRRFSSVRHPVTVEFDPAPESAMGSASSGRTAEPNAAGRSETV